MRITLPNKRTSLIIFASILILFSILLVYYQTFSYDFVHYDDTYYVVENPNIQKGLDLESIKWAFTAAYQATYQPVIWLSYMLDYQLYGLSAGGYHLTNVIFHMINALLLFGLLIKMTGSVVRSSMVAALFALHPLHVESVAWVAERKDVICCFFWLLSIYAYVKYLERKRIGFYILLLLFFILGLLSKPMIVTLPFVLILLDYWPLKRFQIIWNEYEKRNVIKCIFEKIPLFGLTIVSCFATYFIQKSGGALQGTQALSWFNRLENALISYVKYIVKTLLPIHLSPIYLHSMDIPVWLAVLSLVIMLVITLFSIKYIKKYPFVAIGWFWFAGTLFPVIGIIQFGIHSLADRFVYIPHIGLFILFVWTVYAIFDKYRKILFIFMMVILVSCMFLTYRQIKVWSDSVSLFKHAIQVNPLNYIAYENLADYYSKKGQLNLAIQSYRKTLSINPNIEKVHNNLGILLIRSGRISEGITHYQKAMQINPSSPDAYNNLGAVYTGMARLDDAIHYYRKALQLNPDSYVTHYNLANIFLAKRNNSQAVKHLLIAFKLNPNSKPVYAKLKKIFPTTQALNNALQSLTHHDM